MKKKKFALILLSVFLVGLMVPTWAVMVLASPGEITAAGTSLVSGSVEGYSFQVNDMSAGDKADTERRLEDNASVQGQGLTYLGAVTVTLSGTLEHGTQATQRIEVQIPELKAGDQIVALYQPDDFYYDATNISVANGAAQFDIKVTLGGIAHVAVYWKQGAASSVPVSSSTSVSGSTSQSGSTSENASPQVVNSIISVSASGLNEGWQFLVQPVTAEDAASAHSFFLQNGATGVPLGFYNLTIVDENGAPVILQEPITIVVTFKDNLPAGSTVTFFNNHEGQGGSEVISGVCQISGNTASFSTTKLSPFGFYLQVAASQATTAFSPQTGVYL